MFILTNQKKYMDKIKEINRNKKDLTYYLFTYGCQLNENDSEKIAGMLERCGYCQTDNIENAKIIIFNTCCIRENAEEKLFGNLGEVKKYAQAGAIIGIGGCMMQEKTMQDKIRKSFPFVSLIFGTHTLQNLPRNLYEILENGTKIFDVLDIDGEVYEGIPVKRMDNFRASVTITYGCNNFCTFCIVPYVRGRERSRDPYKIIREVEDLVAEGFLEVTLLRTKC